MAGETDPRDDRAKLARGPNLSVGHVAVHLEGAHPAEVPFLLEAQQQRLGPAFGASLASHGLMLLVIVLMVRYGSHARTAALLPDLPNNIIWLTRPGPGGGGGGGGNKMKEPPRKAEDPGKDKITVPVQKPETLKLTKNEPNPLEQ